MAKYISGNYFLICMWIVLMAISVLGHGQVNNNANSITFISGEDEGQSNTFYAMAKHFFSKNEQYRTEIVIESLRSLEDIVAYLENNSPPKGGHWSIVNIVSHSSRFGLKLPLTGDSQSTTTKSWQEFDKKYRHKFPAFLKYIRKTSVVTLWGCSFGKKPEHLANLRRLFRGVDGLAVMRSPDKRLFFTLDTVNQQVEHFYADEYFISMKKKNTPTGEILKRFSRNYKDVNVDWQAALTTLGIKKEGSPFYLYADFRIKFYVDKSILDTYRTLEGFVRNQPEILNHLKDSDIALSDIRLSVGKGLTEKMVVIRADTQRISVIQKSTDQDEDVMVYAKS